MLKLWLSAWWPFPPSPLATRLWVPVPIFGCYTLQELLEPWRWCVRDRTVAPSDYHKPLSKLWPSRGRMLCWEQIWGAAQWLDCAADATEAQQCCWAGGQQTAYCLSLGWNCQSQEGRNGEMRTINVVMRKTAQAWEQDQLGSCTFWLCKYRLISNYICYHVLNTFYVPGLVLCATILFSENHLNLISYEFLVYKVDLIISKLL